MTETWRPVVGFEGLYSVSDLGRVRSERTGRIMRAAGSPTRYPRVNLYRDGVPRCEYVHRVVARAFLGAPQPGTEVNHKDGRCDNPALTNLEYVSHAANGSHAHAHGLVRPARGGENGRAKLSDETVRLLRRNALEPRATVQRLAAEAAITERHALSVMYGERRGSLPYVPGEYIRPKAAR